MTDSSTPGSYLQQRTLIYESLREAYSKSASEATCDAQGWASVLKHLHDVMYEYMEDDVVTEYEVVCDETINPSEDDEYINVLVVYSLTTKDQNPLTGVVAFGSPLYLEGMRGKWGESSTSVGDLND